MPRSGSRVRVPFPAPGLNGNVHASPARGALLFSVIRPGGRVVMQRTANPRTPVQFRPRPPNLIDFRNPGPGRDFVFWWLRCVAVAAPCTSRPDGETGRRKGLKIPHPQGYVGSIPTPGTTTASATRLRRALPRTPVLFRCACCWRRWNRVATNSGSLSSLCLNGTLILRRTSLVSAGLDGFLWPVRCAPRGSCRNHPKLALERTR